MRATVVILLLLVAVAGATWWLFRAEPTPADEAPAAVPVTPVLQPAPAPPVSTPSERVVAAPAGELRIDGRVADAITGERVIGCSVELWERLPDARPPAPSQVKRATDTSRAGGAVRFDELGYGFYVVRVNDDAYTGDDVAVELTRESPLGQAAIVARKRE